MYNNKIIKLICSIVLLIIFVFTLSSCVSFDVNQKYSDKVNKSISENKAYTYKKIVKQLGDPAEQKEYTDNQMYCIWFEGLITKEEALSKIANNEQVYG